MAPPSLRLVWPVRLSVVVDVETGPNLGVLDVFPSNGATCRCILPSTGSGEAQFLQLRRYYETLRRRSRPSPRSSLPPPDGTIRAPAVRSVGRQVRRPRPRASVSRCPRPVRSLRWRRRGLPGSRETHPTSHAHALRPRRGRFLHGPSENAIKMTLRSNERRRPSHSMHFGAQLRGTTELPVNASRSWVTPGPRITRLRLAADLGRMGLDTHRVSNKVSKITSRPLVPLDRAFPAHALLHEDPAGVGRFGLHFS